MKISRTVPKIFAAFIVKQNAAKLFTTSNQFHAMFAAGRCCELGDPQSWQNIRVATL